jgi:ubiquinol-cytochrome c reductase cytochrome b subunit
LLDRPRDHPVRLAVGLGAGTFYGLLLAAGSNDLIAKQTHWPVGAVTWAFRIALMVAPLLVAAVTFVLARALKRTGAGGMLELSCSQVVSANRRGGRSAPRVAGAARAHAEPGRLSGEEG